MEKLPVFRTGHNYDRDAASDESGLKCEDATMTQQHFKEECDINTIVERFGIGYEMPEGVRAPTYEDFTGVRDFQSAMNAGLAARDSFMALPGAVRARFENDPQRFVAFCSSDENWDEVANMGLLLPEAILARKKARDDAVAARAAEIRAEAEKLIAAGKPLTQ